MIKSILLKECCILLFVNKQMNYKYIYLVNLIPPIYIDLIIEFFKIGLFSVGGGFATIPFLYNLTYKFDWVSVQDVSDIVAVATVLPGPIGVSCATFMGWKVGGLFGGIFSAFSLILPSVIVIIIVAKVFMQIQDNKYVKNIFYGLKPVVCGLIGACALTFLKNGVITKSGYNFKILILFLIIAPCLIFIKKLKIHPGVYIVVGAIIGMIFKF